jgi:hypothetical protein
MKLRKEKLSDMIPRMERIQQVMAARNMEDDLAKKLMNTVAKKVATHTLKVIREEISDAIKVTVNGKIDSLRTEVSDHNIQNEVYLKRIMPVVEAYEASEKFSADAQKSGMFVAKVMGWIVGTIISVGSAYLIIRDIFFSGGTFIGF